MAALGLCPGLPASEAWLEGSQKQAEPAWGCVVSHTLTMPLLDPPQPAPQPTFQTRQHSPG